jgi:hypothetical protein
MRQAGAGIQVVKGEADREGACKSLNCAQEKKHPAQANRHIAELTVSNRPTPHLPPGSVHSADLLYLKYKVAGSDHGSTMATRLFL